MAGTTGEFTGVGYIKNANVKADDKDGVVTRAIEVKVIIPEPLDERGKVAFRATIRDVAEIVGERIVIRGETEQVKLPLDGQRVPARRS